MHFAEPELKGRVLRLGFEFSIHHALPIKSRICRAESDVKDGASRRAEARAKLLESRRWVAYFLALGRA